jgi:ABC-type transport system involved in cytochrome bd biosynthesis fused ATPase/permease subunit
MLKHIHPKVLAPAVAALVGCLVTWAATGHFDGPALTVAITGLVMALLGYAVPTPSRLSDRGPR